MTTRAIITTLGYDYTALRATLRRSPTQGSLLRSIVEEFHYPTGSDHGLRTDHDRLAAIYLAITTGYTAATLATFKKRQRGESEIWDLIRTAMGISSLKPKADLSKLEILALLEQRVKDGVTADLPQPGSIAADPTGFDADVTFDDVTGAASYEYRLDGVGAWIDIGATPAFTVTSTAGSHFVEIRGLTADGAHGAIGVSPGFTLA